MVDVVLGTATDFTDSWFEVQFAYVPFNIKDNHWVLLRFELAECELTYFDSLPEITPLEEFKKRLDPIATLLGRLLESVGYYGETRQLKEPWNIVKASQIPIQHNNHDCGVFTIKYFEYLATESSFDTFVQSRVPYFRRQLAYQMWTNHASY